MPRITAASNYKNKLLPFGQFKMTYGEINRCCFLLCRFLSVAYNVNLNLESARKILEIISEMPGFSGLNFSKTDSITRIIEKTKELMEDKEWKEIINSMSTGKNM